MKLKLFIDKENQKWNRLLLDNPDGGHFLQSFEWGEFKRLWGQEPLRFLLEDNGKPVLAFQILKRKTPLGLMWYCPKGPCLTTFNDQRWSQLLNLLKVEATKDKAVLIKIEPEVIETPEEIKLYKKLGLRKAAIDVQLKATIFIDLKKTEDELLASFKPKTRYNIRLAEKSAVVVKEDNSQEAMETLYRLIAQTRERAGVLMRPKKYFFNYWTESVKTPPQENKLGGRIFIASYNGKPLAAIFVSFFGNKIWYKDGGSTPEHKELMAPYLLQWRVMQWAKQNGFNRYDLVGVPPKSRLNEKHPMWGLYRFKSGFSQEITEFVGCLDLPINKSRYWFWKKGEQIYQEVFGFYKKFRKR